MLCLIVKKLWDSFNLMISEVNVCVAGEGRDSLGTVSTFFIYMLGYFRKKNIDLIQYK